MLNSLLKIVEDLGAKDYIKFKGFTSNIFEVYSNSFMFILSSDYEGMSNSMLEALATGIPTLCTDCPVGAPKNFIKHNFNGFLCKVNDKNDMIDKITYIIKHKEILNDVSNEERKIISQISIDSVVSIWKEILEE